MKKMILKHKENEELTEHLYDLAKSLKEIVKRKAERD